jgi:hypothetical protein
MGDWKIGRSMLSRLSSTNIPKDRSRLLGMLGAMGDWQIQIQALKIVLLPIYLNYT